MTIIILGILGEIFITKILLDYYSYKNGSLIWNILNNTICHSNLKYLLS